MTPTSTCNKTMKVKRPKEGGFCDLLLGFVLWWVFFSFYISFKPRKKFITKNLVITFKLNTIKIFLPERKRFYHGPGFFYFCHSLRETQRKIKIKIIECIVYVNL